MFFWNFGPCWGVPALADFLVKKPWYYGVPFFWKSFQWAGPPNFLDPKISGRPPQIFQNPAALILWGFVVSDRLSSVILNRRPTPLNRRGETATSLCSVVSSFSNLQLGWPTLPSLRSKSRFAILVGSHGRESPKAPFHFALRLIILRRLLLFGI